MVAFGMRVLQQGHVLGSGLPHSPEPTIAGIVFMSKQKPQPKPAGEKPESGKKAKESEKARAGYTVFEPATSPDSDSLDALRRDGLIRTVPRY